mmetsp:Transcript_13364/g.21846  ORF Transcript_13364/g.21846 Transcript_13364/m.21846 type:complete len:84 (+) Transcript_13364:943-1194(+)|eukprot:CAMPEP_0203762814 /NCGR_PEP_ID=MMETSP0098-20131031/15614_1 /ASSEMBLY_ACC=CAM_ASM_000208 /TAXON_ID=96639 /ORGANISM=" , Strain NY0313808BC1" /LENGTH=83 /DNA_ID=CAMNT_0050657371 /DNA_START=422 /DNA_END=673 /DNA_ORIENTATION=+
MVLGNPARDAWRKHPMIHNVHGAVFPGLKKAAGIFAVYCVVEWSYKRITDPGIHTDLDALAWSKPEIGENPEVENDGSKGGHQ